MSTILARELRITINVLKECAEDEQLENVRRTALLALDKINLIFNELISVNELLKGKSSASLFEELPSAGVTFSDPLRLVGRNYYYSKVKFLLFKCKELHDLLQRYDTPTPALFNKKADFQREMSYATKEFQPIARKLCKDGVLEDISTMLVRIGDVTSFSHVDALKAIAHYINKRRHNPTLMEEVKEPIPEFNNKQPLKRRDLRVGAFYKNSSNICFRKSKKSSKFDEFDIPGPPLGDFEVEGNIPRDILSSLYIDHEDVADAVTKLVTEKPKECRSRISFIRDLLSKDDNELTKSAIDWAGEVFQVESKVGNISNGTSEEFKLCPDVDTFATRILTSHFPKLKNRKEYFRDIHRPKVQEPPLVRKFKMGTNVDRLRSNTSFFYAREKRLNLDPSRKSSSKGIEEQEEGIELSAELFRDPDPDRRKRDEEIKQYIDRIRHVRMESMERFANTNCPIELKDPRLGSSYQRFIGIRIPAQDTSIIKDRMLFKEKFSDTRKSPKISRMK